MIRVDGLIKLIVLFGSQSIVLSQQLTSTLHFIHDTRNSVKIEVFLHCQHVRDEFLVHKQLLFNAHDVGFDLRDVREDGFLEVVHGHMETILQVIVQLVDLHAGLILESLLITVYNVELVLVVLEEGAPMGDKIAHVAL